jgi:hypothetical protein
VEPLSNAMHAATADPPPTSIDLDRIIAGQRRRHHLQYQVGAVAGVAVLGVVTVTVPALLAGHQGGRTSTAGPHGPCPVMSTQTFPPGTTPTASRIPLASSDPSTPANESPSGSPAGSTLSGSPGGSTLSGSPDGSGSYGSEAATDPSSTAGLPPVIDTSPTDNPRPTEDCAAATARLGADVTRMLHEDLPGVPISGPAFVSFPSGGGYNGVLTIGSGIPAWHLTVMVTPDRPHPECGTVVLLYACTTDPDGTTVLTRTLAAPGQGTPRPVGDTVVVQRPDGTRVMIGSIPGQTPASDFPLTTTQLADIGRVLTLYP